MREVAQSWSGAEHRHELFEGAGGANGVIIFPTVMGISDLERGFAERLVGHGYSVLVADLYGRRFQPGVDREAAFAAMGALQADRAAMRALLASVLDQTKRQLAGASIAAIGFCFGGQCALDLARSGADIAGAASFHGLFDPPGLEPRAITAKVAVYHGWDDPWAKPEDVVALGQELTEAGCDWEIHAYGKVGHGFTNPGATGAVPGVLFDPTAAKRSWRSCDDFLAECFE